MASDCVSCRKPFPLNGELATIPEGGKIAFDPAHRRAWRICAECGEWNLLGPEAAAAAMPELEARFAAAPKQPGEAEIGLANPSAALELLHLGAEVHAPLNDRGVLQRRRQIEWKTRLFLLLAIAYAVYAVLQWIRLAQKPINEILAIVAGGAAFAGGFALVSHGIGQRYGRPMASSDLRTATVQFVLGSVGGIALAPAWWPAWVIVTVLGVIGARFSEPFTKIKLKLPDGSKLRVNEYQYSEMTISWTDTAESISLHNLPGDRSFVGADARFLLRQILRKSSLGHRSATDPAYTLLRTVGGMPGLLHALEGFRRDSGGRVVLAELPHVYELALDLALAEGEAPTGITPALQRKARDASHIARLAEELDTTD